MTGPAARWGTPVARRVLLTAVLGSSMAFLDGTVVNVALPRIGADLHTGLAGLQWVVDAYLVALSALVLLGGALGDRYGRRRMLLAGVYGFTVASLLAGLAPSIELLVLARGLQGIASALLVPGSLALLTSSLHPDDRARGVGAWSGLSGVAGALGPLLGGWLVDALSWRFVFLINVPVALAVVVAARGIPEPVISTTGGVDVWGGLVAAAGLGLTTAGIIEHGSTGWIPLVSLGAALLVSFVVIERRRRDPMVPPTLFSSRQFSGANLVTLAVYAGLGVATFLVVLDLQHGLGYSALEAGAALVPITVLLLLLSARVGALAQRIGPVLPMTAGPLVAGAGLVWAGFLRPGDHYGATVLPAMTLLGLGLALTVAPLTAVVMASVDERNLGVASGVNNAVARLASLLGVAAVPAVVGLHLTPHVRTGLPGYRAGMFLAACLCAGGGLVAAFTIRRVRAVHPTTQPGLLEPCRDPCCVEAAEAA